MAHDFLPRIQGGIASDRTGRQHLLYHRELVTGDSAYLQYFPIHSFPHFASHNAGALGDKDDDDDKDDNGDAC